MCLGATVSLCELVLHPLPCGLAVPLGLQEAPSASSESSCLGDAAGAVCEPGPPGSGAAGWGLPAVVAQLSAALLHCFKGCASTPALQVFCLTSSWVQAWFEFSPKQLFGILLVSIFSWARPLVLIFCDGGFDTCKVTLHHYLVVDSLLLMLFCSLGFPGGTLDKMCSVMHFFFSLLARKNAVCFCFELDCLRPPSFRVSHVQWLWFGCGFPQVEKWMSKPGLPPAGLYPILALSGSLVNLPGRKCKFYKAIVPGFSKFVSQSLVCRFKIID